MTPDRISPARAARLRLLSWRLLYSDASEITRLARLPLGFRLGPVVQRIAAASGRLENHALVRPPPPPRLRAEARSRAPTPPARPGPDRL